MAINVKDFPIPDVENIVAVDEPVVAGGPDAYLSTLPVKAILAAWRDKQIPAYVSNPTQSLLRRSARSISRANACDSAQIDREIAVYAPRGS